MLLCRTAIENYIHHEIIFCLVYETLQIVRGDVLKLHFCLIKSPKTERFSLSYKEKITHLKILEAKNR